MPYTPTLDDINQIDSQSVQGNYQPTLADVNAIENSQGNNSPFFSLNEAGLPSNPISRNGGLISYLGQGGLDALSGFAKAGMGMANTPHNLVNLFSPQMASRIPTSPINENDINQIFGTQNPSLAGKLQEGAAQYLPYALSPELLAPAIRGGQLGAQALAGGAYGATQSQNPLTGGAIGAGINTALSAIPGAAGLAAKGINYLKPGDYADQIVNQLSGGQSLEQSGQSLAGAIKNAFKNKTDFASNNYFNPVLNQVGDTSIYSHLPTLPTGVGTSYRSQQGLYENLPQDVTDSFNGKIKQLNNNFSSNPTFSNAHDLQQQLGNEIGSLQYKSQVSGLDESEQSRLENYANARGSLKNDMSNFLTTTNPDLANLWSSGTDYWRNQVTPYYSDSNIMAMAKGRETNPTISSIVSSFKNPNPDIKTVVNDLPDQAKNSLLYTKLGTSGATDSADSLVKYFDKLDEQGMGSYAPQSLQDQISSLRGRIKGRNVAQGLTTGALTYGALHSFLPPEIVGGATLGSGLLGPMLGRMGQRMLPNASMPSFSQALGKLYPAVRSAVIPNVVGGNQ